MRFSGRARSSVVGQKTTPWRRCHHMPRHVRSYPDTAGISDRPDELVSVHDVATDVSVSVVGNHHVDIHVVLRIGRIKPDDHRRITRSRNSCGYFLGADMSSFLSGNQTLYQTRDGSRCRGTCRVHAVSPALGSSLKQPVTASRGRPAGRCIPYAWNPRDTPDDCLARGGSIRPLRRSVRADSMEYRSPRGRGAGGRAQRLLILEGT